LIEGCKNFSSLQREKKVILRAKNCIHGKKAEAEESRIDFQLTWVKSPLHDDEERLDVDQGSTEPTQKDKSKIRRSPMPITESTKESILKLMLLEVKSVTLAMRSSDDEEVRHPQSSQVKLFYLTSPKCLITYYFAFFLFLSLFLGSLFFSFLLVNGYLASCTNASLLGNSYRQTF
jgi:hypothetical protein